MFFEIKNHKITWLLKNSIATLAGQYFDVETGLHYNWHRSYSPGIGRYVTADPIGIEGGDNLYLYVDANPLGIIDPEGLQASLIIKFTRKAWNHIIKRHVTRKTFPGKSKFSDPSAIEKNVEKTIKKFDKRTPLESGRVLYEKDFGKTIGTKGETVQRVVVDRHGNIVTTFPSKSFKAALIGFIGSLLDPFDAISGELSADDMVFFEYEEKDVCH